MAVRYVVLATYVYYRDNRVTKCPLERIMITLIGLLVAFVVIVVTHKNQ